MGKSLFKVVKNNSKMVVFREEYERELVLEKHDDGRWYLFDDAADIVKDFASKNEGVSFAKNFIAKKY